MKNILRKIGVIGIIIAMLAPFIELPVVKAANEDCEKTLLQYFFLDVAKPSELITDGYIDGSRRTYTAFEYTIPEPTVGKKINIINTSVDNLIEYYSSSNMNDFYDAIRFVYRDGEQAKKAQKYGNVTTSSVNTTISQLIHGYWNTDARDQEKGWTMFPESASSLKNYSYQSLFANKESVNKSSAMSTEIHGAQAATSGNKNYYQHYDNAESEDIKTFFQKLADGTYSNLLFSIDGKTENYVAMSITRKISETELNKFVFGETDNSNVTHIFTENSSASTKSDINDSFTAYKNYIKSGSNNISNYSIESSSISPDVPTSGKDVIADYYWPVILNVEYEVCSTTSEQWTLKYDGNTDDNSVTNIPSSQTETIGTDIQIDAKKPSRDGYTFQGWNTQRDGKGTSYNAEDTYKSPSEKTTVTLYAQWGKGGTEDNKKTGVMSYVVGFITTGLVASGIYLVAKKKNLFKQI